LGGVWQQLATTQADMDNSMLGNFGGRVSSFFRHVGLDITVDERSIVRRFGSVTTS